MPKTLPPLPYGFNWRPLPRGGGTLYLWSVNEMATVEPMSGGQWLARVNIAFAESLHREAVARSKGQACYWVHCWAIREAEKIYDARPESCSIVSRTALGYRPQSPAC